MTKATVLLADRSVAIRSVLRRMIDHAPGVEVVADTGDGAEALRLAAEMGPAAIVMDLDLPSVNGRDLVEKLAGRSNASIFVLTPRRDSKSNRTAMGLHSLGVVAVFPKPEVPDGWKPLGADLCEAIRYLGSGDSVAPGDGSSADDTPVLSHDLRCVAVGASTGGPGAVFEMLSAVGRRPNFGIAIVQHISDGFEDAFADWLAADLAMDVAIARAGERLEPGKIRIAPPRQHLEVDRDGRLRLDRQSSAVGGHRPAADVLFRSLLQQPTRRVAAVLLSGMGSDGAEAMVDLRRADVLTIVQNEASCAVYGMPRAAIERRAAVFSLAPRQIGHFLSRTAKAAPE